MARAVAVVLGALALVLPGCSAVLPGVTGSGTLVESEPTVDSFTAVAVDSAFEVTLTPGDEPAVLLRTDDNVIDRVVATVEQGVLSLAVDGAVRNATLEADLTVPADLLERIEADGASSVSATTALTASPLAITTDGASRVFLVLESGELGVDATGASVVSLQGQAESLSASTDGAASVQAVDLPVSDAELDADGASTIEVTVDGPLRATARGASTIRYSGSPSSVDSDADTSSTIEAG